MKRERRSSRTALNWIMIIVLLLLPVACAVPQGGSDGSLMGAGKRGQQAPSDVPPDYQQEQRRK
jgi:hypothetical protein